VGHLDDAAGSTAGGLRCIGFGVVLGLVSLGAIGGFTWKVDVKVAREGEDKQLDAKIASGEIDPEVAKHKRARHTEGKVQARLPSGP
jgi:hypothetical protein